MLIASAGVKVMESQLLWEFIAFLKARWTARSRVDQRRRRLRQLVAMVRAVADAAESRRGGAGAVRDGSLSAWLHVLRAEALRGQKVHEAPGCDAAAVAGSARHFLAGLRALLVRSDEVDRLTDAVEELERLAGPGGDLDMFVKVLRLDRPARATEMEVDGDAFNGARDRQEEGSSSGAGSVPAPGAKRKRAASSSGADGGSASRGQVVDNTVQLPKRRVLAWMQPHQWLPVGLFGATREPPPPVSRSQRARAVAKAMSRVRRRIGKPTRRRQQLQQNLGQRLSRISL
ncbi:hypothetical protein BAE44_0024854 [Dichanthelium oligosanthes]|uniref:Uncharacterized protein n=1 Tax=Dichanthelium oligosanthes TaxID=888268 RepID=A0A1E5UML2_9POAL|nr:hypothetical protein BAE44_0024854 [Dichanthelium oligosanthes]